ncbi:MAG: GDP-mannose 4,6-dehydratase [Clostridia bacterium]|nr:GDP-mannose 4,6-dehydratase [Clostridia bacterium]
MSGERVLILGAAGFVGPYLAGELAAHGADVVCADRAETGPAGFAYAQADMTDAEAVRALMSDVRPDAAVNLAAVSSVAQSWRMPRETFAVNVGGTLNLLEAARALEPMPRLLLIGSAEEYAPRETPLDEDAPLDAGNPYGVSKQAQEQLARVWAERYGLRITCVRAFNHTGPGQDPRFAIPSWCRQAAAIDCGARPAVLRAGNLSVRRDFTDVRDVARAYRMILAGARGGEVYNVGSGHARRLGDILDRIVALSSVPITVETDPALVRAADIPVQCCDHTRITKALGWMPERALEDTVAEMFADARRQFTAGAPAPATDPQA